MTIVAPETNSSNQATSGLFQVGQTDDVGSIAVRALVNDPSDRMATQMLEELADDLALLEAAVESEALDTSELCRALHRAWRRTVAVSALLRV